MAPLIFSNCDLQYVRLIAESSYRFLDFMVRLISDFHFNKLKLNSLVKIITSSLNTSFPTRCKCIDAIFTKVWISGVDEFVEAIFISWILEFCAILYCVYSFAGVCEGIMNNTTCRQPNGYHYFRWVNA